MAVAHEPVWTLGNRLWRAREEAGLDQETMANHLDVSRALVSKWERDKSEPTVRQVRRWSEITGVSFSWLTEDEATRVLLESAGQQLVGAAA
jgi:transcriptional regulator with XRE-family HTH domain